MSDVPPKLKAASPATSPVAVEGCQSYGVDVGDIVRWHVHGASGPGVPAIVTRVNSNGTLALSVIKVGYPTFDTNEKEAVMHRDDPALPAKVHLRHAGYWTFSPREEILRNTIAALSGRIARLESKN